MATKSKNSASSSVKSEKSVCPVTAKEFAAAAGPIKVMIGDQQVTAEVKEFSTGSFGWYVNSKVTIEVDGKRLTVQVEANLIAAKFYRSLLDRAPKLDGR